MNDRSKKLLMVFLFGGFLLAFIVLVWPSLGVSSHLNNGKGKAIGSIYR